MAWSGKLLMEKALDLQADRGPNQDRACSNEKSAMPVFQIPSTSPGLPSAPLLKGHPEIVAAYSTNC